MLLYLTGYLSHRCRSGRITGVDSQLPITGHSFSWCKLASYRCLWCVPTADFVSRMVADFLAVAYWEKINIHGIQFSDWAQNHWIHLFRCILTKFLVSIALRNIQKINQILISENLSLTKLKIPWIFSNNVNFEKSDQIKYWKVRLFINTLMYHSQ